MNLLVLQGVLKNERILGHGSKSFRDKLVAKYRPRSTLTVAGVTLATTLSQAAFNALQPLLCLPKFRSLFLWRGT